MVGERGAVLFCGYCQAFISMEEQQAQPGVRKPRHIGPKVCCVRTALGAFTFVKLLDWGPDFTQAATLSNAHPWGFQLQNLCCVRYGQNGVGPHRSCPFPLLCLPPLDSPCFDLPLSQPFAVRG